MILLLLSCSINLLANDTTTGEQIIEDSCTCVNIDIIRKANDKLIERKYLLKVNNAQDSIITLNNKYILQQDTVINDLKERIVKINNINKDLQKQYERERKKKIIYGSVAGGCIVGIVITVVTSILINK